MINKEIDKAIYKMVYDIELTMPGFKDCESRPGDVDTWCYYFSIAAKDSQSLVYAVKVLDILDIRYKSIILIPRSYKYCTFDCIQIVNTFGHLYSPDNYNIDTVSIRECEDLKDDEFYITIVRELREDSKRNIIMSYGPLYIDNK